MQAKFLHVQKADAPRIIREAAKLYGTKERRGRENNPEILRWAKEVERELGVSLGYNADSIPWCGLFVAVVVVRAGWVDQCPKQPLWARNWKTFGQHAERPAFGDILVFTRGSAGHVGFYVGEAAGVFFVLGGNQGDAVSIVPIAKSRLLAARRPIWRIAQPASVRPIWLENGGTLSTNEA